MMVYIGSVARIDGGVCMYKIRGCVFLSALGCGVR